MTDEKTRRVKGRLQQSNSKLSTLLDITNTINDNSSKTTLFNILKSILIDELHIGQFVLFTYDSKTWHTPLFQGINKIDCDKINISQIIKNYTDIGIISEDSENQFLDKFDIVIPVFHKGKPLAYMILADIEGDKIEISPIIKHLRFIQTLINIIVVALENKRLNKEQIKQIAVKKELELAQNMQSLLFPRTLPNTSKLRVEAVYLPHSEVGGDYYDVIHLKDDKVALCIADVSGKGMSAALLMANFQANLRALIQVSSNIEELITACNQKVIESADYQKFITLFVAVFDPKQASLTYLNAGHQPAILFQNGTSQMLKTGSTVLGMFDSLPTIHSETIPINSNAKLICFTDGLTELEDKSGNQLEAEGIRDLLENKDSIAQINDQLNSTIKNLGGKSGLSDDITFLTAQFLQQ